MADNAKTISRASNDVPCRTLADTLLDDYTARLIALVEQSNHGLTIDDIHGFLARYKQDALADASPLAEQFKACVDRRRLALFDPNRREPFKRVLAMRFIDLFSSDGRMDDTGRYLSRRMFPGFFHVLEKMVGTDPFLKGHAICSALAEKSKSPNGDIDWEALYAKAETHEAVDDLLMQLAGHFENPMKRISWMLNLVNNDLSDPRDYEFEGEANVDWHLDERGLILILRHLYRHLRTRIKDIVHAHVLADRYGQDATRRLVALIGALDKAEV